MYCTKSKKSLVLYALCTVLFACMLHAGAVSMQEGRLVPKLLNYQGYLTDTLGIPITDNLDMTFKIFDAVSSGNELWSEALLNVPVERGVFSVILGGNNPIPDSVFSDFTSTWLELTLEGPQTLSPRTRITSVGYAYTSTYSDTAEYARNAAADNDWVRGTPDSVLFTAHCLGIARGGANNVLYGTNAFTHVNLGRTSTTGRSTSNELHCTVGGGSSNTASVAGATVSGGIGNTASSYYATVSGGCGNDATDWAATVSGGEYNLASKSDATVSGGDHNSAIYTCATVSGGNNNMASASYTTISGGQNNLVNDVWATIGGGYYNRSRDTCATVAGGNSNYADGSYSTVGGGAANSAAGVCASVVGGNRNAALGDFSVSAGGNRNYVGSDYSAILGGDCDTIATGADYSYLFGINSNLTQDSTFMVDMPHIRFGTEVAGYEFPAADGATDQVLVTDGSGQVSWGAVPSDGDWVISGNSMYSAVPGSVGVGVTSPVERLDVDGAVNVSSSYNIGGDKVLSNAGSYNNFLGVGAGKNNTTGTHNTFLGDSAGSSNTIGHSNTFTGMYAGNFNKNGSYNTMTGVSAGVYHDSGSYNTFTGTQAGFSNDGNRNTFTGFGTGVLGTTGDENTFTGYYAGRSNTGDCNTFTGSMAGYENTAGAYNVFIGNRAGYHNTTDSNKLYIANDSSSTSVLIYGEFDNRRVGIGTTTPGSELSVNGGASIGSSYAGTAAPSNGMIIEGDVGIGTPAPEGRLELYGMGAGLALKIAGGGSSSYFHNDANGLHIKSYDGTNQRGIRFHTGSDWTPEVAISSSGNVGIGVTTPARALHVSDVIRLQPRTDPPASPAMGDMYVDSDDGKLYVYDGSVWQACW